MENKFSDMRQDVFESYETPDPIRIKKVIKFIRKYFGEVKGLNILDCGISKGGVSDILSKEEASCFGVDINPREIVGVKTLRADLNDGIPEINVKFDVIFAGEIMEHLFDDSRFVRDSYKFLKPDGLLIITVPNLVSLLNRLMMFFGLMPLSAHAYAPFHYHIYNKKVLKNLIEQEGFKVLKITSSYLFSNTNIAVVDGIFSILGSIFPSLGVHLVIFAKK